MSWPHSIRNRCLRTPGANACLLVPVLCLLTVTPLRADYDSDYKAQHVIRDRAALLVEKDPAAAIQVLRDGIADHPQMVTGFRVYFWDDIVRFQCFNQGKPGEALETVNQALAIFTGTERNQLLHRKAKVLLVLGKTREAAALMDQEWPGIAASGLNWVQAAWPDYKETMKAVHRETEVLAGMEALARRYAERLGDNHWLLLELAQTLLEAGKPKRALEWAKLALVLGPFETRAMTRATDMVMTCLQARDNSPASGKLWLETQFGKVDAKNPLDEVGLPEFEARELQDKLAGLPPHDLTGRITLLMLQRDWRKAVIRARQMRLDQPLEPAGALELARVLKGYAGNGNLKLANDWLAYDQYPAGKTDPVDALLKELKQSPATPVP